MKNKAKEKMRYQEPAMELKMGYQVTSQEGFAAMIAEAENATKN